MLPWPMRLCGDWRTTGCSEFDAAFTRYQEQVMV